MVVLIVDVSAADLVCVFCFVCVCVCVCVFVRGSLCMLVRKRVWVFVYPCSVGVCCRDHMFEFAKTVPSVDTSARDLV